jgi:hypothetical protein
LQLVAYEFFGFLQHSNFNFLGLNQRGHPRFTILENRGLKAYLLKMEDLAKNDQGRFSQLELAWVLHLEDAMTVTWLIL